jgi:amidase
MPMREVEVATSRRSFLGLSSLVAGGALLGGRHRFSTYVDAPHGDVNEASIAQLHAAMAAGSLTCEALVGKYLDRIEALDRSGPRLGAVLELNPDALNIARALDIERNTKGTRGPLHGIPILLKGSIDTSDRMMTTSGSLALVGPPASQDATVAAKLRAAGAVILGKTNMSEWGSHRSYRATSGWSAVGGQTHNPYVLDRNPSGSSSGSAVATAANLCAASIGTETDLSIVSPASANGVVGIKPTTGLTSRAGVVGGCPTHDTVGVHARTVTDAAIVLGAITGIDPRDSETKTSLGKSFSDYKEFLDPDGLRGARVGVLRQVFAGFNSATDTVFNSAIEAMEKAGAIIVDPADLPTAAQIAQDHSEGTVHSFELKKNIEIYLASRTGLNVRTLSDLIAFNNLHAAEEMPFFGQELFLIAQATTDLNDPRYLEARRTCLSLSREQGIDATLKRFNVEALVAPTGSPAWATDPINGDHLVSPFPTPAGMAGYPTISVPAGFSFGLPVGISFIGTAYSEPSLVKLAFAFEQATKIRRIPSFIPSLDVPSLKCPPLSRPR